MEGVYRVNGGQLTMKKLRTSFDQGEVLECFWSFLSCACAFILAYDSAVTLGHFYRLKREFFTVQMKISSCRKNKNK